MTADGRRLARRGARGRRRGRPRGRGRRHRRPAAVDVGARRRPPRRSARPSWRWPTPAGAACGRPSASSRRRAPGRGGRAGRPCRGAIEHTAPLPRGSSGGPLVDAELPPPRPQHRCACEGGLILALPADERHARRVDELAAGRSPPHRPRSAWPWPPARVARRLRRSVGLPDRDGLLVRDVAEDGPRPRGRPRAGRPDRERRRPAGDSRGRPRDAPWTSSPEAPRSSWGSCAGRTSARSLWPSTPSRGRGGDGVSVTTAPSIASGRRPSPIPARRRSTPTRGRRGRRGRAPRPLRRQPARDAPDARRTGARRAPAAPWCSPPTATS